MVNIEDDHLRRTARCAAGFHRAGGAIVDLQEAHDAARPLRRRKVFRLRREAR